MGANAKAAAVKVNIDASRMYPNICRGFSLQRYLQKVPGHPLCANGGNHLKDLSSEALEGTNGSPPVFCPVIENVEKY